MEFNINYTDESSGVGSCVINKIPDLCPVCSHKITPTQIGAYRNKNKIHTDEDLQIVFRCANLDCKSIFIAYYSYYLNDVARRDIFHFKKTKPANPKNKDFSETIISISKDFVGIYNEAYLAEQFNLKDICGGGYRKALEFLVKDYLIKYRYASSEDEGEKIKKESLGDCIENRIKNDNIKNVAKRATWLGNDEVHYFRKWEQKELGDLKNLIDLTLYWLEAEILTNKLLEDMPDKGV